MKDGDKAKAKAAQAKASGKEARSKSSAKEKGGKTVKAAGKKEGSAPAKVEKKATSGKEGGGKASPKTSAKSNGKNSRPEPGVINFTNPTIENAFRRAVKKYPNAFRRLTD